MSSFVFSFREVDRTKLEMAGGKGANLGELAKIEGIDVPDGFCISTKAFKEIIGEIRGISELSDQLSRLQVEERDEIREISSKIRRRIEDAIIPADIENEIARYLAQFGDENAYAVRSSATFEDLPTASFAGQQDTYLNIVGKAEILKHISKCWASLFTERAIIYRIQNGFDHRKVHLAVVVQKMISPQVAGIMFTADPVTSNRKVLSIDASFGLGEILVSGLVNADNYKVRNGEVIDKKISVKKVAMYALSDGGTEMRQVEPEKQKWQALSDEQILRLEGIGREVEKHFSYPQDIEWCLVDDRFYIVQSRPITTLYPIPEVSDNENHVYVSVGHQQMMTDAMRPLGLSIWQMTVQRPMYTAGGRLFVDVAPDLASPAKSEILVNVLGKSDPIIRDALKTVIERNDFIELLPEELNPGKGKPATTGVDFRAQIEYDPTIVPDLIRSAQTSIEELKQNIQTKSGAELMDFIVEDMKRLRQNLSEPRSFAVILTAMNTAGWLNDKMKEWLGEKSVADTLAQSAPNNVTSEMGLELLDVADVIRPYPKVIEYLQNVKADNFPGGLVNLNGGQESHDAIYAYLNKYGMRCAGEIDITRDRWSEKPITLVPIILSNIKNSEPGAGKRKFEQGRQAALKKEQELLDRLRQLPDGKEKAEETREKIHALRNFAGYREYPKYHIVSRYFIYKQAMLKEAERLVQAKVIRNAEDICYLTFEELCEVIRTNNFEGEVVDKRKGDYKQYQKLTPPRVMTSDGEIISGKYGRENVPEDAIAGLAVSSGVIEGRARIILNIEDADLEAGDILVTPFTDPSWTPLFVSVKGLVTEVGGLMTHGAVIAREYGLPAVVGVEKATSLIKDGQRIRVNGTDGYVEIL